MTPEEQFLELQKREAALKNHDLWRDRAAWERRQEELDVINAKLDLIFRLVSASNNLLNWHLQRR